MCSLFNLTEKNLNSRKKKAKERDGNRDLKKIDNIFG
jgi:hypothetical protein